MNCGRLHGEFAAVANHRDREQDQPNMLPMMLK